MNHVCDAQAQRDLRELGLYQSHLSIIDSEIVEVYYRGPQQDDEFLVIDGDGGEAEVDPMAKASTGDAKVEPQSRKAKADPMARASSGDAEAKPHCHMLAKATDFQKIISGQVPVVTRMIAEAFPKLTVDDAEKLKTASGKKFQCMVQSFGLRAQDNMDTMHCDK